MLRAVLRVPLKRPYRLLYNPTGHRKCYSSFTIDPSIGPVASNLARKHPAFTISSSRISILSEPGDFYTLLLDMIQRAEKRIFISSLYIGSAESQLIDAMRKSLLDKPSLRIYLQLDFNRSTRPGTSSTAKLLLPLLREFPDRVQVSLFRSPHLRGLLAKIVPPRFNEGWGTWHAKIYGADDELVISGANLNQSYFTNRQDRYIHFAAQQDLAEYCFDFLKTVSTFSYKLSLPSTHVGPHSYQHEGYTLQWHSKTHPHHIHGEAEAALSGFQQSKSIAHKLQSSEDEKQLRSSNNCPDADNVLLFPIIQAGQFNIREEESALSLIYNHLGSVSSSKTLRPLVDLTSGYFGLYRHYKTLILTNNVDTRILVASPKANGFFGSRGISGRIPEGYTLFEQRFMKAVRKAGRLWDSTIAGEAGRGVQLSEWERAGWTYHAKGMWLSPDSSSPPVLTLFGSTNLNSRSAHIDTELSFIMVVPSSQNISETKAAHPAAIISSEESSSSTMSIRHQLADEVRRLRLYATDWKGAQRHVRFWTKVIVQFVKGML